MGRKAGWASLIVWALAQIATVVRAGGQEPRCMRIRFEFSPTLVNAASWSADEGSLAMVDLGEGVLLEASLDGKLVRRVTGFSHPGWIGAWKGGYLLIDLPVRYLELDAAFRQRDTKPLTPPLPTALGAFEYPIGPRVSVDDRQSIGLGILSQGDQRKLGVVRVSLDPPAAIAEISMEAEAKQMQLYVSQGPFVATLGGTTYVVRVSDRYEIVELGAKSRTLAAFPAGFERLPALPPSEGAAGVERLYAAIEKTPMFSGLFAGERGLHVLTRRPEGNGTRWQLSEIDTKKDAVVGTLDLPTRASHLVVLPGKKHWAILEKGSLTTFGQAVQGALLIPSSWLATRDSPLARGEVQCGASLAP